MARRKTWVTRIARLDYAGGERSGMSTKPKIRELFIEELAEVQGGNDGNPLKTLLEKLGCCDSTMACCEEGQCCADPA